MKLIKNTEGTINFLASDPSKYKLDSKMPVFYNPIMQINRDINILLLKSINRSSKQHLRVLDLLAGTGIRGLRIKKEVPNVDITINDINPKAIKLIRKNAKNNKLEVKINNKSANVLLSELKSYDYIDIDPFGTPISFLDSSIKRLSPHGIIGVTATDTSALCGTYPKACKRKYGSTPLRNEFMHETGTRILIHKIQQTAAQYDVALEPIFSHSTNHYIRVYLKKSIGASRTNKILNQHGYILYCRNCCWRNTTTNLLETLNKCPKCNKKLEASGPIWLGKLWDSALIKKMIIIKNEEVERTRKVIINIKTSSLMWRTYKESLINSVGFYDLHQIAKQYKIKIHKDNYIINKLRKEGFKADKTHFRHHSIRTNAPIDIFI